MDDILKPKIDLKQQPSVVCDKCSSDFFQEVVQIKKVSKILTGTPDDTIVPFPTYRCADCGNINDEFKLF